MSVHENMIDLMDFLATPLILTDLEGHIELWNHAAATWSGWQSVDVMGLPIQKFLQLPFFDWKVSTSSLLQTLQQEAHWSGAVNTLLRDGREIRTQAFVNLCNFLSGQQKQISFVLLTNWHNSKVAQELHRLELLQLVRAHEDESARLARELHDEIGQMATAIQLDLRNILDLPDAQNFSGRKILLEVLEVAVQLLENVRNLSLDLHPPLLDDLGLVEALRWHLGRVGERGKLQVHFEAPQAISALPSDVSMAFYRVAQEALTNILRHARATQVWLSLLKEGESLTLQVRDDGVGFETFSPGKTMGIRSMRERAALIQAHFDLQSAPGKGNTGHSDMEGYITVLLADDHRLVRAGLRAILEATDDIRVVAEACDGWETLTLAEKTSPQVILLDISMPGLNGLPSIGAFASSFALHQSS